MSRYFIRLNNSLRLGGFSIHPVYGEIIFQMNFFNDIQIVRNCMDIKS